MWCEANDSYSQPQPTNDQRAADERARLPPAARQTAVTPTPSGPHADRSPAAQIRYWIGEERTRLLNAVDGLTEDQAREPMQPGDWSAHDVLAHRLFWERSEVEAIGQYLLGKRIELLDFPVKRVDGANRGAVQTLRSQPTEQIIRELAITRAALQQFLDRIRDDELDDPGNDARTILGIALEHDREHAAQINEWRRRRSSTESGPRSPTPPVERNDR